MGDFGTGVIIGAGVVGLAIAAELSQSETCRELWVLEKDPNFGSGISSRNSEVIHAGIYYPPGSLKARLCIEGKERIYALCARHAIPHQAIGKLVVAADQGDLPHLEAIDANARACGVRLEELSAGQARELEPSVRCVAALHSPGTGIVDSHSLMRLFYRQAESCGVQFVFNTAVEGIERLGGRYRLQTLHSNGERFSLDADLVINAAGLFSDKVARMAGLDYSLYWCKGCYFSVDPGRARFCSHLIYPVVNKSYAGLGVHLGIDLSGRMRLGPDVEYIEPVEDYSVSPARAEAFYQAASRYLPFLEPEDLSPEMAGIRPKLQGPSDPVADFVVRQDLPGFVNCVGIESPGLTASPAIGGHVRKILREDTP